MRNALYNHLLERSCDPKLYAVHLNDDEMIATFMLFAPGTGKFCGYQTYRPGAPKSKKGTGLSPKELRYFTHVVTGELALFGAETLDRDLSTVYLVEGIFDAVKLHSLNLPCLAVLGNNPKPFRAYLRSLNRHVIGVLDNDNAGKELAKFCDEVFVCKMKDPGDMTLLELKEFLKL